MAAEPERPQIHVHTVEPIAPRRVEVRTGQQPAARPAQEAMERNAEPVELPVGPYRPIEERGDAVEVRLRESQEGRR